MNTEELRMLVQKKLSKKRFEHSLGVADAAKALAKYYGESEERAYICGLLHDSAKELPLQTQLELALKAVDLFDSTQIPFPELYHGPAAATYIPEEFSIMDEEIRRAVGIHVIGRPGMTSLEKILFVADYTEVNRQFPWRKMIEEKSFQNLEEAVFMSCEITIHYLEETGKKVHPGIIRTRDAFLDILGGKN